MKTLVLVEDSDLIRNRMVTLLTSIPGVGRVHCAPNLEIAQDLVGRQQPHLVVLDLALPDGNGMHWIRLFKLLAPRTRIAVFTNDVTEFCRNKCLAAGAQWFFDKSSECDALISVVRQQCTEYS